MAEALPALLNIADEFISRPARAHPQKPAILGIDWRPQHGALARRSGQASLHAGNQTPGQMTYAQLESDVNRVAKGLRELGCRPRDRVLIAIADSIEFIASFFGAAKIGAIAVPVNSMAREQEYQHCLRDSGARFAIVHAEPYAALRSAARTSALECVIVAGASERIEPPARGFTAQWEEWLPKSVGDVAAHATAPTDPAFFLYTSGTGGPARATVHCHKDMLYTSRGFAQGVLGLRADDRTFSVSKLFFAYGLGNGMYFPFSVGAGTLLYPGRPRPDAIAEFVTLHKPTVFFSVPTFYASLLREADAGSKMDFSSVRLAVSAGEALPAEIFKRFRQRFRIEILDGIGSTEMLHMYLACRPGAGRPGSCGVPVPGYAARILDEHEKEVPESEVGNLWVRGGSMFAEYWNHPELTARVQKAGWFSTNDKFTRDADGFYHYHGRADDMIKVSGMWVSPGEVENALLGHPAVSECAVVGRADGVGLVRPIAYIVLRSGITAPAGGLDSELSDWLHARLVGFKCPQQFHFVAELPKTATGKIQRFLLRQS
jgi:benzoate-CoA ligase family protein